MNPNESPPEADESWIAVVRKRVEGIRFGSVQITVHEGRVTQIEAIEKTRFAPEKPESGRPQAR